jgi:hypothetical protein
MPMADDEHMNGPQDGRKRRRWRWRIAAGLALCALLGGSAAWFDRERIAADVITDYLAARGVQASYDIISLSPREQVIANLVVGDPAKPDFTAKRMAISLGVGWAGPEVRGVAIEGARVYARLRDGTFSLGSLDPLVFTDSDVPPSLPAIDLTIRDGRALLESDYGPVGIKLEGAGRLDDGFAGSVAAVAPGIGTEGCRAERATLFGKLVTAAGAPRLAGPLRLTELDCGGARLARADIGTIIDLSRDFSSAEGDLRIEGRGAAFAAATGDGLSGTAQISWTGERLALAHDLALVDVALPQGRLARLSAEGAWRGAPDLTRGQWEGELGGSGLQPGAELDAALGAAAEGTRGTFLAPLIAKARGGTGQALAGARFAAKAMIRHKGSDIAFVLPEAALKSRSGTPVLAISQASAGIGPDGLTGLKGNILAGGEGLPNINGRMEQQPGGGWAMRLVMAEYAQGANRLAIPRLTLRAGADGSFVFDGLLGASGDLPGGAMRDLVVPLEGRWTPARGLAFGTRCLPLRFAGLELSGLTFAQQGLTICPDGRGPMLAYDDTLTLAARTGAISLAGQMGDGPATLAASALRLRYPEPFALDGFDARIGSGPSEMRLAAASLTGSLADVPQGRFEGASARLGAVPFDLDAMAGRWRFADGVLQVDEASFLLSDRPETGEARFNPLGAQNARLTLADNRLSAEASLRHLQAGARVADVMITHDLDTAKGGARLRVPGITFDKSFQPEDLSMLAKGVIAFADGTVTGDGRIDWQGEDIASTGTFASNGLDFAAAFGPVRGLAGKVVFSDLVNLTTAPDQVVRIAAINPGIEVLDGTVRFDLREGTLLSLRDAHFPFMGGDLRMRPLVMDFSQPEARRYVFEITGLDAATFVAQMELTNLGATGTFDGTVPVVFDANGNGRIEGGVLIARAPGGNVAYIGELTYENLGAMGNYAFQALRSLDYRQMSVGLNGDLAGEIITNFDFDGVRQGEGTSRNFVTRRLAKLPIRFKVNVRSENFHELATMVRSFWDIDFLGSPVDRGLLTTENGRFVPARPPRRSVQPPESESQP